MVVQWRCRQNEDLDRKMIIYALNFSVQIRSDKDKIAGKICRPVSHSLRWLEFFFVSFYFDKSSVSKLVL